MVELFSEIGEKKGPEGEGLLRERFGITCFHKKSVALKCHLSQAD